MFIQLVLKTEIEKCQWVMDQHMILKHAKPKFRCMLQIQEVRFLCTCTAYPR